MSETRERLPVEPETPPESWSIRRILVALDASAYSRAALTTAVSLAEALRSEVHGLFIEDINLLRLAELPFAREVRFAASALRPLETSEIERKLRARAAILRRELEELTGEHKITGHFTVTRGPVDRELLAAALETDLLAVGRLGHSIVRRTRLGSTARVLVTQAASAVLLVRPDVGSGPIVAIYDGSAAGRRALGLAADLARRGGDLRVLVWAPDEESAFERRQLAAQWMESARVEAQYQHLSGDAPHLVLQWINRQKGNLLILPGDHSHLPEDIFALLLDEADQHVLVVR